MNIFWCILSDINYERPSSPIEELFPGQECVTKAIFWVHRDPAEETKGTKFQISTTI